MNNQIRNFCIIAHIDHGKSTLADRLLEITGTIPKREMRDQVLDQMDLERERGITIKLQPVRMNYEGYELNLIDTPGHVDFSYEVSRSLAAVEGALLLVDATQGIEAQTLANLHLAQREKLTIIPVINKIDLPGAEIKKVSTELAQLLNYPEDKIILASAKEGRGVKEILDKVISDFPGPNPPTGGESAKPLKALIFDSKFDEYKGVIAYIRVFEGSLKKGDKVMMMATKKTSEVLELGYFKPELAPKDELRAGEIGYLATGLKELEACRIGDTITLINNPAVEALSGYAPMKPMVFAGLYPKDGDDYVKLKEALGKLRLNDAAFTFTPENYSSLGFGFRGGFLGVLHLEIVKERLRREYGLEIIVTVPSVAYHGYLKGGRMLVVNSPLQLPEPDKLERIEEPWMKIEIITPQKWIGNIMKLVANRKGKYLDTEYLSADRAILHYEIPLGSILVNFYDRLKSVSSGYASLNYDFSSYQPAKLLKLEILVAGEKVDPLASLVYEEDGYHVARRIVDSLKEVLPRQMFEVKVQGAIAGKIIAAASIPAMRKDVVAKLYGGDVTRKMKLLEKQKKGKRKMKAIGKVNIPSEAFLAVLRQ